MSSIDTIELLSLLKDYICSNQLSFSQYSFLASEKHKKIKDLFNKINIFGLETRTEIFKEELKDSLLDLENFLYQGFEAAFGSSYKYSLEFFSKQRKHAHNLRACIKVFIGNEVVALLRQPPSSEPFREIRVEASQNTAFRRINEGEKYYLCNNIPLSAARGEYRNTRLIYNKVAEYNVRVSTQGTDRDLDWEKCWKPIIAWHEGEEVEQHQFPADPETCYKSTLVIPMSLVAKDLEPGFATHFKLHEKSGLAIFGFLCFDHRDTDFFEDSDHLFGYILADVLSLYLIQQLTYTQYSSTYYRVVSWIEEN